jgi:hypothetical protein
MALLEKANVTPASLLRRHWRGDWGDLCPEDVRANEQAIKQGARILSSYSVLTDRVWIITEADRAATTLLLPSEY